MMSRFAEKTHSTFPAALTENGGLRPRPEALFFPIIFFRSATHTSSPHVLNITAAAVRSEMESPGVIASLRTDRRG